MRTPLGLDTDSTIALIRAGLTEDLTDGPDATTQATVPDKETMTAHFVPRFAGVVAGLDVIEWTMREVSPSVSVTHWVADGDSVSAGQRIATVSGPARAILTAERTALNLLTYASGIATHTSRWVAAVAGTRARVRDTRKTLPGYRRLAKYAVACGGGVNHRMSLGDAILIKDNHVDRAGSVTTAFQQVCKAFPDLPCEVEVDTLGQLAVILTECPDLVLLDNFSVTDTRKAVAMRNSVAPQTQLESSGGLTLDAAADYASTGVDFLAVGALTHSVTVLDIGLDADL